MTVSRRGFLGVFGASVAAAAVAPAVVAKALTDAAEPRYANGGYIRGTHRYIVGEGSNFITSMGTAASISGQGTLSTREQVRWMP